MRRRHCAIAIIALLVAASGDAGAGTLAAPGQSAPIDSAPPSISGSALVGSALTANAGTWQGPSPTFAFQWSRCLSDGSSCTPMSSATGQSYTPASADLGTALRVTVTATNKNGTTVATSAPTSVIAAAAPTPPPTTTTTTTSTSTTSTTSTTTPTSTTTGTTTTTTTTAPPISLDAAGRWYDATSAFNMPIPASPTLSSDNSAQISWLVQNASRTFGPTVNSVPSLYTGSNTTPLVTVQVNYPTCNARQVRVPIPSGAKPGAGTYATDAEPTMVVANRDTGEEWDLFKVTPPSTTPLSSGPVCPATANWAATVVGYNSPGWTGTGTGSAYRGSGTLAGAGTIRPRDTKMPAGSTWDHAIAVAYPHTRNTYVAPAKSSDGQYSDSASIPMGTRIQLDPTFNVETSGLPEWQKQICRTLQTYGMIVVDSGSAFINEGLASVRASGYTWPWEPGWAYLPSSVLTHLRVLR